MEEASTLTFVQPEYDCPVHGSVVSVVTFNSAIDGSVRHFCMECCFEKIVGLGVSEVTEKKP